MSVLESLKGNNNYYWFSTSQFFIEVIPSEEKSMSVSNF